MDDHPALKTFALSTGGLYDRLLRLTHLEGDDPYHVRLRIVVIIGITWLPLIILSIFEGTFVGAQTTLTFLNDPIPHARLLIALPLLVSAGVYINRLLASLLDYFNASGLLPETEKSRFYQALDQVVRRRDSIGIELVLLALAFSLSWWATFTFESLLTEAKFSTWALTTAGSEARATLAGWWFLYIDIPLLLFMLFRWLWRYLIWIDFLRRLSHIPLRLQPTHSDLAGGIGILGPTQYAFGMVFVAMGTIISPVIAYEILYTALTFDEVKQVVIAVVVLSLTLMVGPLLMFTRQLARTKRQAVEEYGVLQHQLSRRFHENWITNKGQDLVDSPEPSAMADYGAVFQTIRSMRLAPIPRRGTIILAVFLFLPFLPLWLINMSLKELLLKVGQSLF